MKCYIGSKIIVAQPERHADGREGYRIVYPDGYASWNPKATFETAYREVTFHERQLIEQTDAEHQISAISDGEPERCHEFKYSEMEDIHRCIHCGRPASEC